MIIFLILTAGFILRIINLDQSLWLDEATQLILSAKSISEIIHNRVADFHPPLSYLLYHFWLKLGSSEVWLRLLPVIFGVATVFAIYLLTIRMFNKRIALLSALLLSISPYHIYYSQEVRMYSLAALLATLSMYFFVNIIKGKRLTDTLAYVIATTSLLYTHYLGVFLVLSQFIFILICCKEKTRQFIAVTAVVTVLYIPWLPSLLKQLQGGSNIDVYLPGWREMLTLSPLKAIPLTIFKFSAGRIDFDNTILYMVVALVVLSIFGYLVLKGIKRELRTNNYFVIFWFFVPLILAYVVSFKIPLNQPFRLLFILPAFYILISLGIDSLSRVKGVFITLVVIISLLGLTMYYLNPRFYREDWRGAVKFLDEKSIEDQAPVVFIWPEPFAPYIWYSNNLGRAYSIGGSMPYAYQEVENSLQSLMQKDKLYLFRYLQKLSDPNENTKRLLYENNFKLKVTYDFRGVGFIDEYQKN